MAPERWEFIKDASLAALPLTEKERNGFLAARFGDGGELIEKAKSLLQRHISVGEQIDDSNQVTQTTPADGYAANGAGTPSESVGQMIGHYKLLQDMGTPSGRGSS